MIGLQISLSGVIMRAWVQETVQSRPNYYDSPVLIQCEEAAEDRILVDEENADVMQSAWLGMRVDEDTRLSGA
jgi:hypothetical protein